MPRRHLLFGGLLAALIVALPGGGSAMAASGGLIAVAIDFGTGTGALASVVECVHEQAGATSGQALNDALSAAHIPLPSYDANGSGLLCSLGGYPAQGCGVQTPSGYHYWAYFHGDGSGWHYAQDGPNERSASSVLTEGWRFEDHGHGNPSDPPLPGPSSPAALCGSITPTTRPVVVPTTTTPTPAQASVGPTPTIRARATPASTGLPTTSTSQATIPAHGAPSTTPITYRAAVRAAHGSSGPPVGALIALGLVAVGAIAGLVLWRVRRP